MEKCKSSDHGSRPSLCGDSDIDIDTDCCSLNSFLDKPISPTRPRLLLYARQPTNSGATNNAACYVGRTLLRRPKNSSSTADDKKKKPLPTEITSLSAASLVSCLSLPSACSLDALSHHENEDFVGDTSSAALQRRMNVKVRRNSRVTPLSNLSCANETEVMPPMKKTNGQDCKSSPKTNSGMIFIDAAMMLQLHL
mmetsp:Transcript_32877/g.78527  ORF Transcript_32877/g.78527 Transcript_32877/m.78527 type:complete len:196 (-) Transcript_32877:116-703(-)